MDTKEFARRRKRLMDRMGHDSIAILPTAMVHIRNNDVTFPFRPDSDFFYLTGYPEPEAVAAIIPDRPQGEFVLFCRKRDPRQESWDGKRAGLEGACEIYGANDAFPIETIDEILPGLLENRERIYYNMGREPAFDRRVMDWVNTVGCKVRSGVNAPDEFFSLRHILHELRLYKSRREISLMRRAANISVAAHKSAMRVCQPGMTEYQIEAELIYQFMRQGAKYPAYPSIVGSGANGCILHYTDNDAALQDGDLLLVDAGSEYQGYASDITRTFPINGKFTQTQKDVYEVVLQAQLAAIEQIQPGKQWNEPHETAVKVITQGLVDLGILKGDTGFLIEKQAYAKYYMHRTSHWLGMDVHDAGDYKVHGNWRTLEPGMALTVEPGLYLSARTEGLDKKWWNIGIRIEDDVLVTRNGNDILSKDLPKEVSDIEAFMVTH